MMSRKIILASSSPRRSEILGKMGLEFEILPSDYEEILDNVVFSYEKIEELAYNKAMSALKILSTHSPFTIYHSLILSADTVVVLDNGILGKPQDVADAVNMLLALSGKRHSVVTSICAIRTSDMEKCMLSTTSYVEFNILSEDLIKNYIEEFKPFDKAGSYGIQELPDGFIKSVEGSFENIIGLCPIAVKEVLKKIN